MSDLRSVQTDRSTLGRRKFLGVAGAGVAGGSLLTMLDARQAPAQIKGTTLRILQWSHFIPAYDAWYDKFAREWGDKNGVKVRVDHIPHLDIPARMAAEFAAGAGHDIIYNGSSILTRLYYKNLVDLTDVADQAGKKYGGWIPAARSLVEVEGRWFGLPIFYILAPMLYRKDLFDASNLKYPDTWELARVAARTLRPKGHPTGIALYQCADASDNRYLASGIACWVHDAISAYRTTEDTNPPVFSNTFLGLEPQGLPGRRVSAAAPNVWMVWKFSKNQQAAKEWLAYLIDNDLEGMVQSRGYNMPYLTDRYKKPMPVIGSDPKLQILQDFPKIVAFYGYPGPSTTPIQEIVNTFIFPDMITKFCRGQSMEEAIKWGLGEYRRIYAKHKQA